MVSVNSGVIGPPIAALFQLLQMMEDNHHQDKRSIHVYILSSLCFAHDLALAEVRIHTGPIYFYWQVIEDNP